MDGNVGSIRARERTSFQNLFLLQTCCLGNGMKFYYECARISYECSINRDTSGVCVRVNRQQLVQEEGALRRHRHVIGLNALSL